MHQLEDFFDVVIDMGANMAEQNIRYAEITLTPPFYLNRGHPLDEILGAMNLARRQTTARWGVGMRWIPDLVRGYPAPASFITEWASSEKVQAAGVVALGLGVPEVGYPASSLASHFSHAQSFGLPATPHAGEGVSPARIWETTKKLQPTPLGHGVRATEDNELLPYLATDALPLEVSLTSNICLGVYPSYSEHLIKRLIDAGCTVTLNTDDPVLFQATLTEEYLHAICDGGLDLSGIRKAILDAVASSNLFGNEKQAMLAKFQDEFIRLEDEAKIGTAIQTNCRPQV